MKQPIFFAALALLSACAATPAGADSNTPAAPSVFDWGAKAVADPATGCEYLVSPGAITPRTSFNTYDGGMHQRGCR